MATAGRMAPDRDVSPSRDAFLSAPSGPTRLRYSNFDSNLFTLGHATSPEQAKRALEAHLADTQQRMEEAGKLGTTLLQQQKELTDQLKEVEKLQAEEADLTPELNRKLADLENEYMEVARESARAFLPKQRVPSNEEPLAPGSSPFAPPGTGGRRSVSPSKFESRASGSPTRLNVPNRKQRNQPVNRIHDIEFAAEISTSLIQQVRHLQALLSEKEEELKETKTQNSRLEIEFESYQQRVKALDESENKYKDENWNLETQIHDLIAAQKESADREKKLAQALNVLQADKNATQRELDEVKVNLSKLDEKHAAAVKQHDIELGTAKRKEILADGERAALQRKVEDLTGQNQELAKAFSQQRARALERDIAFGAAEEDFEAGNDAATPEHSPPQSPVKLTPRHSALESETLKTSLLHAQRTIQSLRSNIHREKTEKIELRRVLQETRDDLEKARTEPPAVPHHHRRSKKVEPKEFKKPLKPGQLGAPRASKSEVVLDDTEWEDHSVDPGSPRSLVAVSSISRSSGRIASIAESSAEDHLTAAESTDANFETAAENSDAAAFETAAETDAAFETAHETEDFHTGAEEFSDDSEATETEVTPSKAASSIRRPPVLPYGHTSRYSFESTASTSADDDEEDYSYVSESRTPKALQPQKLRMRSSRGTFDLSGRRSRMASEEPNLPTSPQSFTRSVSGTPQSFTRSVSGTPQAPGQSLAAELENLEGSDDDSLNGMTPGQMSTRSMTPASKRRGWTASALPQMPLFPKVAMVNQGTMTDPVSEGPVLDDDVEPKTATTVPRMVMVDSGIMTEYADEPELPEFSPQSVVFNNFNNLERPTSMSSVIGPQPKSDAPTQWLGDEWRDETRSRPLSTVSYSDSGIQYDPDMEAKLAMFPSPPTSSQKSEQAPVPIMAPPQELSASYIHSEHVEPEAEPLPRPPTPVTLIISSTLAETVEPVETPVEKPALPTLGVSSLLVLLDDEPVVPPEPLPAPISVAEVQAVEVQPRAEHVEARALPLPVPIPVPVSTPEPVLAPVPLSIAAVQAEEVLPHEEPKPALPALSVTSVQAEEILPHEEPKPALPTLSVASVQAEEMQPQEAPLPLPIPLSVASVQAEEVQPQEAPLPPPIPLSIASVQAEEVQPRVVPEPVIPAPAPIPLSIAGFQAEEVQPREEPREEPKVLVPAPVALSIATFQSEEVQPRHEPKSEPASIPLSQTEILTQAVEPISQPEPPRTESPVLGLSTVQSLDTEPVQQQPVSLPLGFSSLQSLESEPVTESPRSPKRGAFIIPRDKDASRDVDEPATLPRTPQEGVFAPFQTRNEGQVKGSPETPVIAEDETRQSLSASPAVEIPESQRPLKERSSNTDARPVREQPVPAMTIDSGAQTSLTATAIDEMFMLKAANSQPGSAITPFVVPAGPSSPVTATREINDPFVATPEPLAGKRRTVDHGLETVVRTKSQAKDVDAESSAPNSPTTAKRIVTPLPMLRRPSSSSSNYDQSPAPPLPPNHKEVIEAARLGSSSSGKGTIALASPTSSQGLSRVGSAGGSHDLPPLSPSRVGSMGPPPLPAKQSMESSRLGSSAGGQGTMNMASLGPLPLVSQSRNRGYRPGTPKQSAAPVASGRGTPTPRPGRADMYPHPPPSRGTNTQLSHKSSISSFVSELDNRFDMGSDAALGAGGMFGGRTPTDPRMIRAITQVMIGEYLWKYTRKAGREEMSENRHRRYFWLHPYNRTLYWSENEPGDTSRAEIRSKSLAIQAVRMVADSNPMPPGLHNKSLLVISGKRTIKFTAPTGQRHEIWFNALSFILKKPGEDEEVMEDLAGNITHEDVAEFNPADSVRASDGTRAPTAPSLTSYNSRTTPRMESPSPVFDSSMSIPTLTPLGRHRSSQTRLSTMGKIGSYWGSLRSRSVNGRRPSLYDANSENQFEANDSAEDLRAIIEQQDRDSDRLENVRACCDGKHDVGGLHISTKKGRHSHSHPPTPTRGRESATPTPSALETIRSRA